MIFLQPSLGLSFFPSDCRFGYLPSNSPLGPLFKKSRSSHKGSCTEWAKNGKTEIHQWIYGIIKIYVMNVEKEKCNLLKIFLAFQILEGWILNVFNEINMF